MPVVDPRLFAAYALTLIILSLKALFLGVSTAARRGATKQFLNAEDAAWLGGVHVTPDPEPVARIGRAHRNDVENLLPFALCCGIYVASGGWSVVSYAYCGLFLFARILHTVAYLGARPSLRRNTFTLGFMVIVVVAIHAAWLVATKLA